MNPFSYDGLLVRFLNLVADLVALHVLWLLCSLPIVTMGASTTALYYASMRRIRTDESHVHQNFFRSFRQNFRQSTILWLMMLVVGAVLLLDFRLGLAMEGPLSTAVLVVSSIVTVPFLMDPTSVRRGYCLISILQPWSSVRCQWSVFILWMDIMSMYFFTSSVLKKCLDTSRCMPL